MTEPVDSPIDYELRNHAAWITLNAPHNHNALSESLSRGLAAAVQRANGDDAVRMLVLTAVGRTFCAGADLKSGGGGAVAKAGGAEAPPFVGAIRQLWDSPKPVLGRIQGNAYGGGLGLIAACDLAVCVDTLRVAFTEVRLGLAPSIISVFVMRKISLPLATRYFLTGERFGATEALEMGLIHRIASAENLDAALDEVQQELLQCGPRALQEVKALLRTVPQLDIDQGLAWAQSNNLKLFNSEEGREGMAAFAAKRPPAWAE